ncbi:MAG: MBL fold metallo-hydrolase [Solirubrobacterales bacterium]|nr:MBL fold metallo-hydrolase [Solirubrobacterales bacterium]
MSVEVADGVWRLGTRWVNWYFIQDGDRLTVVDAGLPQYWDQLPAALGAIGRRISDVDGVFLTHAHFDVLGSAERVRAESGGQAYIHPADAAIARMQEHPKPRRAALAQLWRPGLVIFMAHLVSQGGMGLAPLTQLATVSDDEHLDLPGHPRVIATPGHTPGHCSLLLAERGVLFSGDALTTFDATTRTRGPRLMSINADRQQALASLSRLELADAKTVLPGRGAPWRGGIAEAVRRARAE